MPAIRERTELSRVSDARVRFQQNGGLKHTMCSMLLRVRGSLIIIPRCWLAISDLECFKFASSNFKHFKADNFARPYSFFFPICVMFTCQGEI